MARDVFTVALNVAEFPFVTDFFQRSIVVPGIDIPPRVPKSDTGIPESKNPELVQHYFAQDVMPTNEGLMSVGYINQIAAIGVTDFDQMITLRDQDENNFLYSPAGGKNYVYRADAGIWASKNPFVATPGSRVTRSFVNGRTFVCYQNQNIYEYDSATDTFNVVAITGLSALVIDGISASNNYHLAWSRITVYWSSLVSPTDFTASITTGAGFATPQDVKGPIINIVPISGGFIIYTTKNAVAALYTQNARAPFVFREVSNTGGITDPEQVSLEATLGFHYAWTSAGLQRITATTSEAVSGPASDFLAGRILETFDSGTLTLTLQRLSSNLKVKLTYASGRYLVISYGVPTSSPQTYSHALVFDTVLKRWGKLKVDHVDCHTYPYPNFLGQITESPHKQSLSFLQQNGAVLLVVMDYREQEDAGVLILGRFQLVRQKHMTFQQLELESLLDTYEPNVYLVLSDDGKTQGIPQLLQRVYNGSAINKYGAPAYSGTGPAPRRTGKSFSVLVTGTFELSTAVATTTRHGDR